MSTSVHCSLLPDWGCDQLPQPQMLYFLHQVWLWPGTINKLHSFYLQLHLSHHQKKKPGLPGIMVICFTQDIVRSNLMQVFSFKSLLRSYQEPLDSSHFFQTLIKCFLNIVLYLILAARIIRCWPGRYRRWRKPVNEFSILSILLSWALLKDTVFLTFCRTSCIYISIDKHC